MKRFVLLSLLVSGCGATLAGVDSPDLGQADSGSGQVDSGATCTEDLSVQKDLSTPADLAKPVDLAVPPDMAEEHGGGCGGGHGGGHPHW